MSLPFFFSFCYAFFFSSNFIFCHSAGVPDAPDAPSVSEVFRDSALVSWQPPANDGGSPVTGYTLERQASFSPRWTLVNKAPVAELSLKVDDLIEDNSYQFRVIAHNKAGPSEPSQPSPQIVAKDPWSEWLPFTGFDVMLNV